MLILGIETSCDETSAAVVRDGDKVLTNVVYSQEKSHRPFKGIVPEIASRAHVEKINGVIEKAMSGAGLRMDGKGKSGEKIDAIAVTLGPGLIGSLLVGKMTAEALGWSWDVPVIGVNHLEAHLLSPLLSHPECKPPFAGMVVSGGHTDLILVEDFGKYTVLGRTRDDSAGETFDKVSNILGLGYPGGPRIDAFAKLGNSSAVPFPRPYMKDSWDFSFSGLKTAVLYHWQKNYSSKGKIKIPNKELYDLCASFQSAVVDVLIYKIMAVARKHKMSRISVGGGVSANSELRRRLIAEGRVRGVNVYFPSPGFSTDNAAMIAAIGSAKFAGDSFSSSSLKSDPSLPVGSWKGEASVNG